MELTDLLFYSESTCIEESAEWCIGLAPELRVEIGQVHSLPDPRGHVAAFELTFANVITQLKQHGAEHRFQQFNLVYGKECSPTPHRPILLRSRTESGIGISQCSQRILLDIVKIQVVTNECRNAK